MNMYEFVKTQICTKTHKKEREERSEEKNEAGEKK